MSFIAICFKSNPHHLLDDMYIWQNDIFFQWQVTECSLNVTFWPLQVILILHKREEISFYQNMTVSNIEQNEAV